MTNVPLRSIIPRPKAEKYNKVAFDFINSDWFWKQHSWDGECLIWNNAQNGGGYGTLRLKGFLFETHIIAFSIANEGWPTNLVLHTCDRRSCDNPEHLFEGTYSQNTYDMYEKGRGAGFALNNKSTALLTKEQILQIRAEYTSTLGDQKRLAEKFGVSEANISLILNRISWRDI